MIESSREILERSIKDYKPYAIVLMVSGGKDSRCMYEVAKILNVKYDFVLHGVTGTGIKQTREYVHQLTEENGDKLIEANAGDAYEKYVLRKGFFGRGNKAHSFAYHVLKSEHFNKCISKNIRQGKRGRKILLINGVRSEESTRRKAIHAEPIREDKNNIWVNLIHYYSTEQRNEIISDVKPNPVYKNLCKSGECMCGTMQTKGDRTEASFFYPEWGKWIDKLEAEVKKRGFTWGWGEEMSDEKKREYFGQLNMFNKEFQPMCTGCKINYNNSF